MQPEIFGTLRLSLPSMRRSAAVMMICILRGRSLDVQNHSSCLNSQSALIQLASSFPQNRYSVRLEANPAYLPRTLPTFPEQNASSMDTACTPKFSSPFMMLINI